MFEIQQILCQHDPGAMRGLNNISSLARQRNALRIPHSTNAFILVTGAARFSSTSQQYVKSSISPNARRELALSVAVKEGLLGAGVDESQELDVLADEQEFKPFGIFYDADLWHDNLALLRSQFQVPLTPCFVFVARK